MRPSPLICLLALAACGPKPVAPPAQEPTPAAAPAASNFSHDMDLVGTEPFWNIQMRGTRFTLTRPDHPDLVAQAPGAMIIPGKAEWTATAASGQVVKVTLYVSDCSDGMSDRRYPMTAEVVLGSETLRGCAAPVGAFAGAPKP